MSPVIPKSGMARYIVRSEDVGQLVEFLNDVKEDPNMELLDTIGPSGKPHTAVVVMNDEKATSLEQRFRASKNQLKIEPDRPLSLFDKAGDE